MRAATKPLRAVALSLALAAVPLAATAQESAPSWQKDNPIFRQGGEPRGLVLPPAQQRVFDRDAALLADIRVELAQGEYRRKAGEIDAAAWRSRAAELQAAETALRRKWQGIGTGQDLMLSSAADSIARERMAALRAQYDPPKKPTPWNYATALAGITKDVAVGLFRDSIGFLGSVFSSLFGPLAVLVGVVGLIWLVKDKRRKPKPKPALSDNYGSARYADVRNSLADPYDGHRGVFFGKSSAPELSVIPIEQQTGAPVLSTPEHHTLIVARTRTGKGTRVIVPTLLRYGGSAIVIDPKGENAAITARIRRGTLNSAVHVINPWGELAETFKERGLAPATFNPLDVLVRDDPNAVAVAQALAAAVCPTTPGDKDRYWQGSAANVLTAVLLWITDQPGEQKTLARAREIVSLSRRDFTERFLVPMAASSAFGGAIREMVSPYLDLAQETYSGIMSNLSEATKFLSDPQVKAATAKSTFDMADLIREAVTVYLVIPPDRIDTQRTWLRLMTTAAMHTFKRYPLGGRPPHRCMILMDEFPALGRIEDLPRDIATMSGYGIDFTLIVQGLDQLKDLYGAAAGTILSNCAYKWFCNVNDLESANYLSETLGKVTVQTVGHGEGQNFGPGGGGHSENLNYGETGRPLLMPDEVLALGRDVAIVLNPTDRPHYVRPVDYWRLPDAFAPLASAYPHLYWDPPLAYDDNPYFVRGGKQDGGHNGRQSGGARQRAAKPNGKMTRAEALDLLGLSEGATAAEVRAAWKRLMQKVHPDTGGSARFAQMLNEARDVLSTGGVEEDRAR